MPYRDLPTLKNDYPFLLIKVSLILSSLRLVRNREQHLRMRLWIIRELNSWFHKNKNPD